MKLQTKISDLKTLIASTDAASKARRDADALTSAITGANRDRAITALDISLASRTAGSTAGR